MPDSFRALARSSPWRWRRLHLSRDGVRGGPVEAWIDRPGRMRVRTGRRVREVVEQQGEGYVATAYLSIAYAEDDIPPTPPPPRPPAVPPLAVAPVLRPDGLVAERPEHDAHGAYVSYDDPMWQDYEWVAMLDPVELSQGVAVTDLAEGDLHGRAVWWASAVPQEEYEPRCGCCALLRNEPGDRLEWEERFVPGHRYPEAYRVALDVETAIVVSMAPIGETDLDGLEPWSVRIHEVDGPDPFE